jgi:prepilin-type N-terminal cleavage/methylation domain-containing protein
MKIAPSGFTLAEMLVTIAILGVIATAVIPRLSSDAFQNLNLPAEETANTLRIALSEARRTGGYVLVDGETASGHLKLYRANSSGTPGNAISDPLTKLSIDLDVRNSAFSPGVTLTPQFIAGGNPYMQLLIGPGITQMQVYSGSSTNRGLLQPGSGVLLNYGGQSAVIGINEITGLVTLP